ncbi:MAG: DNA alkylation repair protein [Nitrospiraceae bacterium]|nr:MAG: DNA alkylation repair protein [Nitrospiraceae bacterium]
MIEQIKAEMKHIANPEKAVVLSRFFKTGKGEYGEGDLFLGITVPEQRKIARKYSLLPLNKLQKLLSSKIHEHRLTALLILVIKYGKADEDSREDIFNFYLSNMKHINNWDLVDLSADKILGTHLLKRDRGILFRMAKSRNIWERRIAIMTTFHFIKNNQFSETLAVAEILLNDSHDLIHKAVGWMLREIGKRDRETEERFLLKYYSIMPRTMLRYAIEKFDDNKRKFYLRK